MKGPQFLIYIRPLVEVLRNSGGSGSTADIIDQVIDHMKIFQMRKSSKQFRQEHPG